jgi:hypothetical protein
MFIDGQKQNYENDYITKSNLQIQCNLHQHSNDILHRNGKKNPTVHTEV